MNPFLELSGAVESESLGVAAHYGEPLPEQRALAEGRAAVDLSHRGIVRVTGEDRLSWLNSMTSQRLTGLAPGESVESLLLDANGRIEHAIRLVDDGEASWLLVDEGSAEPLSAFLLRMRFALRVAVEDVSSEYAAVLAFAGPASEALRAVSPVAVWEDPWRGVAVGGVQYSADADHPGHDWSAAQFVCARTELAGVRDALLAAGCTMAGLLALDALEIRAWRPSRVGDVDERAIPHEFDWLRTAVHLTKGCYRGQETIAKVHNLGHPPRRLVLLHLDGAGGELPEPGALIFHAPAPGEELDAGARPVGRVTRAARHYEWGGIALALLKRAVPHDAQLAVALADPTELIAAAQEVIVPSDAGATANIPKLKRL